MYNAVAVQSFVASMGLVLALGFVVSMSTLAIVLVDIVLLRGESPRHKARKRLHMLAGNTSEKMKLKIDLKSFEEILGKLSALPGLRIIVKPLAARIEKQRQQNLRESCMNDLPEMVDILSLALGAGLSIDQAFEWYLNSYETPLAAEFRRAEQAYQVGMLSRMKAFEELAESLQEEAVLRFVNSLRQAFTLGSALGPALDILSQDVRKYRMVCIEERIAKTPVKILAPLGLCIVPAVLILLMGPIMTQVMQGFRM